MGYGGDVTEVLYGGDYNPEQWPEHIWEEDMRLFKNANINIVTLNVFSWASLQPSENEYDFSRLDRIMQLVKENGLKVCMATSTGAHPAWMAKRHPDILRTDANGIKRKFGGRHNSCPNSPTYRKYAPMLARELSKRYKNYDNIVGWHISNEFGGECYCENCERAFRKWLKEKYKNIETVNQCYNTAFWGHTFYDFDEIVLPNYLSEHFGNEQTMFQGISLDYRRFMSDSMLECFKLEYDSIKMEIPDARITTNFMWFYKGLDYRKWAEDMDFVSWDCYPSPEDKISTVALCHDLMRGLKNQNSFVLMEQTPSVTNWQPVNKIKKPGEMRLLSYLAMAHGADAIQFFQLRRSIGACEKFHGAVIDHAGRDDTRVYKEVKSLGNELTKLSDILDARTPSEAAIIFDWDNWWSVEYSSGPSIYMKYLDSIKDYYSALYKKNIPIDIIGVNDDFSRYKLVIAPLLYMIKDDLDERLRRYVSGGGTFITTYFSGLVNDCDLVTGAYPGKLKDILGIWVEEQDALLENEKNSFIFNGKRYPAGIICDIMHTEGAKALSCYESDFYKDTPVITENIFGRGRAYYVGSRSDEEFYSDFLSYVCSETGVEPVIHTPNGVEAALRVNDKGRFLFLINHLSENREVVMPFDAFDLLNEVDVKEGATVLLVGKDVKVYRY
jgi:beta-galactosidase 1